jgi:hypothetical protein
MDSSTSVHRELIDKTQVANEESIAWVKAEQEWQKVYTGAFEGDSNIREFDELLNNANRRARLQNY